MIPKGVAMEATEPVVVTAVPVVGALEEEARAFFVSP
jgi:hypothetical protein